MLAHRPGYLYAHAGLSAKVKSLAGADRASLHLGASVHRLAFSGRPRGQATLQFGWQARADPSSPSWPRTSSPVATTLASPAGDSDQARAEDG
jgi:hypothetical protein